ncbi:hypothetical protein GCM10010519_07130 [Streptomyces lactacystinicus]
MRNPKRICAPVWHTRTSWSISFQSRSARCWGVSSRPGTPSYLVNDSSFRLRAVLVAVGPDPYAQQFLAMGRAMETGEAGSDPEQDPEGKHLMVHSTPPDVAFTGTSAQEGRLPHRSG